MTSLTHLEIPSRSPDGRLRPPRRCSRLVLAGLVTTPLVGFLVAYLIFFTPNSPPRLKLAPVQPGTQALDVPEGSWSVTPGSVAGYRVREQLLALPAASDAVGRTEAIAGGFRLQRRGPQYLVKQGLRVDVDLSTLKSDEQRRDDHMRTMAIETARFPTATFVSTEDLVVNDDVARGAAGHVSVVGVLTLHGVTRSVTIPLDVRLNGRQIEVVGSLTFGWDLFDITPPNLSYVTVEDHATLEFRLLFAPATTGSATAGAASAGGPDSSDVPPEPGA